MIIKQEEEILQERLSKIQEGINTALEKGSENEDVLEIMKELLLATKVKNKMKYYLDD